MKKSTWHYYSVKLIYQAVVVGVPVMERVDKDFDDTHTFFEESIVLVHARSFDHAYVIAEKIAKDHVDKYRNTYGQVVEWRLVEAIDCFLIGDKLANGIELYSSVTTVKRETIPDDYLMQRYQYNLEDDNWNEMRRQECVSLQRVLTNEKFSQWRKVEK